MLGLLGKRAIDVVVLLFAAYAFVFVPLGKRTGLEHLRAILETRAAQDAGREVTRALDRLKERLLREHAPRQADATDTPAPPRGKPLIPRLPREHAPANALVAPNSERPDASL